MDPVFQEHWMGYPVGTFTGGWRRGTQAYKASQPYYGEWLCADRSGITDPLFWNLVSNAVLKMRTSRVLEKASSVALSSPSVVLTSHGFGTSLQLGTLSTCDNVGLCHNKKKKNFPVFFIVHI
jgi:hypothetical protein